MLIRVTVENFKSYDGREELCMIPSDDADEVERLTGHLAEAGGIRLLKYASVHGANASGKSNLVTVFSFLTSMLKNADTEMHRWRGAYCRNRPENEKRDSFFEIQFSAGDRLYAYGFTAVLSREKITGEWMNELFPDGRADRLFERKDGDVPELGERALSGTGSQDRERFDIYARDFTATKGISRLFLAEMNRGKFFDGGSGLFFFKQAYDWLTKNVIVITPSVGISNNEFLCRDEYMERLSAMMDSFDTGITEVSEKKISKRDIKGIPVQVVEEVLGRFASTPGNQFVWRYESDVYVVRVKPDGSQDIGTLVLRHRGSESEFCLSDESDGTRRLFDLVDILITDRPDTVYVVDELERSLHPNLTEYFFRTFAKNNENGNTQLIVATHERALLRREFFRRDETWFVEKDRDNASRLYSLDTYKQTCDDRLADAYLEGRFGAVPILDHDSE